MSFRHVITTRGEQTHVEMIGEFDEEASLPRFAAPPRRLVIDLGGVTLINSMGCRRWVTWIAEVSRDAREIELERCSHAVVQQLNILGGFLPATAKVNSFFVPYECPKCGRAERVLHRGGGDFTGAAVPEHLPCAGCGGPMNLEVLRPAYFKFLSARPA